MTSTNDTIDTLNDLLKGELSAVETYQQALGKLGGKPEASELRTIEQDHRQTVEALRRQIVQLGGQPEPSSGAWGTFAEAVTGGAKLLGENAVLDALKRGEEHGANNYQDALKKDAVMPEMKDFIRNEVLPRTRTHITELDRLKQAS